MGSNIEKIVDLTALIAASRIDGIKAVAAIGLAGYDDPLRPGHKIGTAQEDPSAALTHWSEAPGAPPVEWVSQDGSAELKWTIPMRLWLPKQTEQARRIALPFYDRYLAAFLTNTRLSDFDLDVDDPYGNYATRTEVSHFSIGGDSNWSWLNIGLTVVERVKYEIS